MTSCIFNLGENDVLFYFEMFPSDALILNTGEISAAVTLLRRNNLRILLQRKHGVLFYCRLLGILYYFVNQWY